MKQAFVPTLAAQLSGIAAVIDFGIECHGYSDVRAARAVARSSRLPGFWRLKAKDAQA